MCKTAMRSLCLCTALVFFACAPLHAETCVAVIGALTAGFEKLVPLLELELGKRPEVTLLEREKIQEILHEQELQALLSAERTAKRSANLRDNRR